MEKVAANMFRFLKDKDKNVLLFPAQVAKKKDIMMRVRNKI